MSLRKEKSNGFTETLAANLTDFNDGSISTQGNWVRESVRLPPLSRDGTTAKLMGSFDKDIGSLGLDGIRIRTGQKCLPKYIVCFCTHESTD